MSEAEDPSSSKWPASDLTFAARELEVEFPSAAAERISEAVNSATPFVSPERGRVQLLCKAREFFRT